MKTFTIDETNNISAWASQKQAVEGAPNAERFSSQRDLAELAANWPSVRVVEVWNSLPGVSPVKKFTDRKTAVARIWKAIQSLDGGSQAADIAPAAAASGENSEKKTHAKKTAKASKPTRKPKAIPGEAREGSKKAVVLALLKRPGGATLNEFMATTAWQAHSVRGFISGSLGKKMGIKVKSSRREDGERVYQA